MVVRRLSRQGVGISERARRTIGLLIGTVLVFGAALGASPRCLAGAHFLGGSVHANHAAAFPCTAPGCFRRVDAFWRLHILRGGADVAFALMNTARQGRGGAAPAGVAWDRPALPGAFAVAFDVHDPPTENPFNADGNIYGRPQREVALYWDGREVVRRLSPVEFRGRTPRPVHVGIRFVCGGANVTVRIAGVAVYASYFVPGMTPYESRAAFGSERGKVGDAVNLPHVVVAWSDPTPPAPPPLVVTALSRQILDHSHSRQSRTVAFPNDTDPYGRILCTLTLSKPPNGYDPWDRQGAVYAYDNRGTRFEILRFITPYGRGGTWTMDVSDYRPLLRGTHTIEAWCETYSTGWDATVSFAFYPGYAARLAYKILNLWHGQPVIGDPDHPISQFFAPQSVVRPPGADSVKLRFIVTGHGQAPNTGNAAEFLPSIRAVSVCGMNFTNLLWKTDNYLNPCSPQGGTWKYDRAGWGPGTVVAPWDIEATRWMPRGQPSVIRYQEFPYVNTAPDPGNPARHWVESQVIFYHTEKRGDSPDLPTP